MCTQTDGWCLLSTWAGGWAGARGPVGTMGKSRKVWGGDSQLMTVWHRKAVVHCLLKWLHSGPAQALRAPLPSAQGLPIVVCLCSLEGSQVWAQEGWAIYTLHMGQLSHRFYIGMEIQMLILHFGL